LWVIRDFLLKKVDEEGNPISSKKYLENSLREQNGDSEAVLQKNRMRRLIKSFFQDRDCHTLVRPTEDEKNLQRLNELPKSEIREEFENEVSFLRTKIFNRAKPKSLNGQNLNGPMLLEVAAAYTKAINEGQIPVIQNAFDYMQVSELQNSFKSIENQLEKKLKDLQTQFPISDQQLKQQLLDLKSQAELDLKSKVIGDLKDNK